MFGEHTATVFHPRNVSSRRTTRSHLWRQHGSNNGLPERMWSYRKTEEL